MRPPVFCLVVDLLPSHPRVSGEKRQIEFYTGYFVDLPVKSPQGVRRGATNTFVAQEKPFVDLPVKSPWVSGADNK